MFGKLRNDLACRGKYIHMYARDSSIAQRKRSSEYTWVSRIITIGRDRRNRRVWGFQGKLSLLPRPKRENLREVDTRAVFLTGRNLVTKVTALSPGVSLNCAYLCPSASVPAEKKYVTCL